MHIATDSDSNPLRCDKGASKGRTESKVETMVNGEYPVSMSSVLK